MNKVIFVEAGLTEAQARAYIELAKNSPLFPPELSKLINESRTNTYKILEQLEDLGLAEKDDTDIKLKYWAKSPQNLLNLLAKRKEEAILALKKVEASMPALVEEFIVKNKQPNIRYYQGHEGLIKVYKDQISTAEDIYYIRTLSDALDIDEEQMHLLRNEYAKKGIHRYGITQDHKPRFHIPKEQRMPINESDKIMNLTRRWIKETDYDSPVEWATYGDKLSIISFGQEIIATIIDSPQIADAFKQIYKLLERSIAHMPGYDKLPVHTTYTRLPESVKTTPAR